MQFIGLKIRREEHEYKRIGYQTPQLSTIIATTTKISAKKSYGQNAASIATFFCSQTAKLAYENRQNLQTTKFIERVIPLKNLILLGEISPKIIENFQSFFQIFKRIFLHNVRKIIK